MQRRLDDRNEDARTFNALLEPMGVTFSYGVSQGIDIALATAEHPLTENAIYLACYDGNAVPFSMETGLELIRFAGSPLVGFVEYGDQGGQVLVIAKKHQESGFSRMDEGTAISLLKAAKKLSEWMIHGLSCREVTFKIEGLEVAHAHAKIFPVYSTEEYVRHITAGPSEESDDVLKVNSEKIRKKSRETKCYLLL